MGLLAGLSAARLARGKPLVSPPQTTAIGGLVDYISNPQAKEFQPMNVNFGLLPPLGEFRKGRDKRQALAARALKDLEEWKELLTAESAETAEIRKILNSKHEILNK